MERDNEVAWVDGNTEDIKALIGIDLQNAYGEYYRSGAIKEVMEQLPRLTGIVRSELQNGETEYWQKMDGKWVKKTMWRGGYQGKRLIIVLFCCSLIWAQRAGREKVEDKYHKEEAKLGYQDDNYLVGKVENFVEAWPATKEALEV